MEIVIATTDATHAEGMRRLVGHTMSGERLEQRPMVQCTSAEDFLDAALKLYRITAIRLMPSTKRPGAVDVVAEYEPVIFRCVVCGAESTKIPDALWTLRGYKRFACCEGACEQQIRASIHSEVEDFRRNVFGNDPVGVALAVQCAVPFEVRANGRVYCKGMPEIIERALTKEEFEEAIRQWRALYKTAMQELAATLQGICERRLYQEDASRLLEGSKVEKSVFGSSEEPVEKVRS